MKLDLDLKGVQSMVVIDISIKIRILIFLQEYLNHMMFLTNT
jgi:hypothetical protein